MYRFTMGLSRGILRPWGRMTVTGLEHLPPSGPVLLAGNHDSYWDPVAVGAAAMPVRQIHALAKRELWSFPLLGPVLDGMGQIPIERGTSDHEALATAARRLREGACIGIFPEGTRSKGSELRARSGFGRLAHEVPEATFVCVAVRGTTDVARFPRRPRVEVEIFRPESGDRLQHDENPSAVAARLLEEIRERAPRTMHGWAFSRGA
jgi:1-acyl-sn-glycerol-3-phosphate acyltransferase